MVGKRRERDPVAELARLIAHADTHEESAPSNRFRLETGSEGYDDSPELSPAPQLAVDQIQHDQTGARDEHYSDDQTYDVDDGLPAAEKYQGSEAPHYLHEEEYQDDEVPGVRRRGLTLVMAMFGLALVGMACAVGYRYVFGGPVSPPLPPSIKAISERNTTASMSETPAASSGNAREVGPAITGSIDKMAVPRTAAAPAPRLTIAAAPRPSGGADDTVATNHERLAAVPAESSVAAPVVGSGYAVQVTSERSESRAQAAFRALQANLAATNR
jgi:hypothetical protein